METALIAFGVCFVCSAIGSALAVILSKPRVRRPIDSPQDDKPISVGF